MHNLILPYISAAVVNMPLLMTQSDDEIKSYLLEILSPICVLCCLIQAIL